MSLFKKLFGAGKPKETTAQQDARDTIAALNAAQMELGISCYQKKDYAQAFRSFKHVAENSDNSKAQYNLASLYAQGLGTERDFAEAAYWFNRARQNGEEGAYELATKCLLDYVNANLRSLSAKESYESVFSFMSHAYSGEDISELVRKNLLDLGVYYFDSEKDYAMAAKLFRAGAEYGGSPMCRNYLAVLYNAGAGVEKNDLAALYWFDRASEQGVQAAKTDRDGILNAYISNLGKAEAADQLKLLAAWCAAGLDEAVPQDPEKAAYWTDIAASLA